MISYLRRLLCVVLLFSTAVESWAFSGAEGASFLDVPVGAGPAAMGSAYSALANDMYAPVWNPAGLGFLRSTELGGMHQAYIETSSFEFLSFVHPFKSGGGLGFSTQYFRPGDFDATDASGNFTGQKVDGYYGAYSLAYGRKITETLALGLTGKMITAKIDTVSASAYAADAGLFYRPNERLTLAAVVANLGTQLQFLNESDPLPEAIRAGGAVQVTNDIRVSGEGSYPKNGPPALHMGIEWPSEDNRGFCIRTGYSTDRTRELSALAGLTVGAGIPVFGHEFSYAWMPLSDFGSAHYFSLKLRFGQEHRTRTILSPHEKDIMDQQQSGSNYQLLNETEHETK